MSGPRVQNPGRQPESDSESRARPRGRPGDRDSEPEPAAFDSESALRLTRTHWRPYPADSFGLARDRQIQVNCCPGRAPGRQCPAQRHSDSALVAGRRTAAVASSEGLRRFGCYSVAQVQPSGCPRPAADLKSTGKTVAARGYISDP